MGYFICLRVYFQGTEGQSNGSFFRGLFHFVKPLLYSGAKAVGNEFLITSSNTITDIFNKEREQRVGDIFKTSFSETNVNLKGNVKKLTCLSWIWNGCVSQKEAPSQGKRRKMKDIWSEEKKYKGMLKIGSGHLHGAQHTNICRK